MYPVHPAIHRIKALEITDIGFQPEKFDFDKMFNRHFGVIKEKAFAVEVEFTGWAAKYVTERIWSSDQEIIEKAHVTGDVGNAASYYDDVFAAMKN